ncbi:BA75_01938T0 [Komagataella pastoris]|uniref:BA75_01938T0 n=1 Tax=Komagataella pastoris TaxID=4922 RepID=A0A1B2JD82_PICPA|nr:BA75_01938T0 [Komagataella pastoris]
MVLIAAGQMCSGADLAINGRAAARLAEKAAHMGCKALFLPEAADYVARNATHSKSLCLPSESSPFVLTLQSKLRELKALGRPLCVCVGVHEPANDARGRVKNTLLWLNSHGDIAQRYQKLHLFDVALEDGRSLRESDSVQPGANLIPPFSSPVGKVGLAICYDIRFPELSMRLRALGAQLLAFPSAFTMRTGAAHWELLGRARAVDTQCYVVMAAQAGRHGTGDSVGLTGEAPALPRESYGHAMIVDPWGSILAQCSDVGRGTEDICIADIDLDRLDTVRRDMPLWEQRRSDVFGNC